jgi:hypothetical protein
MNIGSDRFADFNKARDIPQKKPGTDNGLGAIPRGQVKVLSCTERLLTR